VIHGGGRRARQSARLRPICPVWVRFGSDLVSSGSDPAPSVTRIPPIAVCLPPPPRPFLYAFVSGSRTDTCPDSKALKSLRARYVRRLKCIPWQRGKRNKPDAP